MDSATAAAMVRADGYRVHALAIDYGQRARAELDAARRVAAAIGAESFRIVSVDLRALGGSALTDDIDVPLDRGHDEIGEGVPTTYVPARNTVFLSLALAAAESLGASGIVLGVNAVDYSGYPDCRPAFIDAFQALAAVATKAGVEGSAPRIEAPLLKRSKADIIRQGAALGVDYGLTVSCYNADPHGRACARCDACRLRAEGFRAAGLPDPTPYLPA